MPDDPTPPDPHGPPADPAGGPPTEPMPVAPESQPPPTTQMGATPTDPNPAVPNGHPDPRWYDNRAAAAAVITVGLLGVFLLIGWLWWWSTDDDDAGLPADSIGTAVFVDGSTLLTTDTTTIPPASVVEVTPVPTVVATLPPATAAPTTAPATAPATTTPATAATTTEATTTVPSTTTSVPVVTVPPSPSATLMDILDVSPDLSRLDELVTEAGLVEMLAGDDPLTLLAPSNQAIETLEAAPGGSELLADPDRLRNLLLGHVVPGALDAATIFGGDDLTTTSGAVLVVDPEAETVGGASMVVTDVTAANGVLHVVDRVFDEA